MKKKSNKKFFIFAGVVSLGVLAFLGRKKIIEFFRPAVNIIGQANKDFIQTVDTTGATSINTVDNDIHLALANRIQKNADQLNTDFSFLDGLTYSDLVSINKTFGLRGPKGAEVPLASYLKSKIIMVPNPLYKITGSVSSNFGISPNISKSLYDIVKPLFKGVI